MVICIQILLLVYGPNGVIPIIGTTDLPPSGLRVGGQVRDGHAEPLDVVNPGTGRAFAGVSCADELAVDQAVRAADDAFRSGVWQDAPAARRARTLNRFADLIEERLPELYRLETLC